MRAAQSCGFKSMKSGGEDGCALSTAGRLLRELNDQSRLQHNLRSRQVMNAMSKLQNLRPDVGMKITFAEFSDTVRKAMSVAPPSQLLGITEYECCGGTEAVFDHYYAVTVPKLVVPLMDRADVHVQYNERWQVTNYKHLWAFCCATKLRY